MDNDILEKLKQIEFMAKTLASEGEKLNTQIVEFQSHINRINPPFEAGVMISDKESILWSIKDRRLIYQTDKSIMVLTGADVPVRRKAISFFPKLLDDILEGYTQFLERHSEPKRKSKPEPLSEPVLNDFDEVIPKEPKPRKIKRKGKRKAKRIPKENKETTE